MLVLMPDDGSHARAQLASWDGNCYICCLRGSSRSHRSKNRTTISAPCITTALLLLCDTDQLYLWVSRHLARTHTQNRFPGFTTSKKQASRAKPPIGNTLPLPSPHCDAASQVPTLPTKETPETPPPQAVKLHICGYLLFLP